MPPRGAPPLKPRRDGTPARGPGYQRYSWPPFEKGNAAAALHGAGDISISGHMGRIDTTGGRRGMSLRAQERAEAFLAEVLESPVFPEYLKAAMFRSDLVDWCRAQTQADMVWEWLQTLTEDEQMVPQRTGFQKTPVEQWQGIAAYAARCRQRLGLNPTSYAKLRVALGLHKKQQDDAIAGLAKQGQKIRKRREAKVIQMRVSEGAEGA